MTAVGGSPVDPARVAGQVAAVRARIAAVAPMPDRVTVVAVTKGFGLGAVDAAVAAGLADIGENYAQELLAKASDRPAADVEDPLRWHFLGAIQRNKVARLAPLVACWHTVARVEEAFAIARHRPGARVLVEVDVTGTEGRNGCRPEQVAGVVGGGRRAGLDVVGLMTVAPPGTDRARAAFSTIAGLADDLGLPERSMGMSDDYELALELGSTMVRLGRVLFGDRPPRPSRPGAGG